MGINKNKELLPINYKLRFLAEERFRADMTKPLPPVTEEELQRLHRNREELSRSSKSADWKLALALALKARTTVTNRWLGEHLHLGARDEVCRKLNARKRRRKS